MTRSERKLELKLQNERWSDDEKEAYIQMFFSKPWCVFATLTFPTGALDRAAQILAPARLSPAAADPASRRIWRELRYKAAVRLYEEFIDHIERNHRNNVIAVRFAERNPTLHFHVLLYLPQGLDTNEIEWTWRRLVGEGQRTPQHPLGDSAHASKYDPHLRGVRYCMKFAHHNTWVSTNPKRPKGRFLHA